MIRIGIGPVNKCFVNYTQEGFSRLLYVCDGKDLSNGIVLSSVAPHRLAANLLSYLRYSYRHGDRYTKQGRKTLFRFDNVLTENVPVTLRKFVIDCQFRNLYVFSLGTCTSDDVKAGKVEATKLVKELLKKDELKQHIAGAHCLRV